MADTVGILGTGRMGMGLARECARIGRSVSVGSREADRAREAAAELPDGAVRSGTYGDVASGSDMVIVAVPFAEVGGVLASLTAQGALRDTIVVDITNPFGALPASTSAAEEHRRALADGSPIVAAWKTNFWKTLDPLVRGDAAYDVFACSDDASALGQVLALAAQMGFHAVDCGALANARVLDAMVPLLIELDGRYSGDHRSGWRFTPSPDGSREAPASRRP
jgi:8-hydroxy-5-deazaflavin:NADPH oxidoreductase